MITVKEFPNQEFDSKEELFKALKDNKKTLIAQKKMEIKHADAFIYAANKETSKAEATSVDATMLNVKVVINTTKIMDSHNDVHLDGIWTKTLKENKDFYLLQEHQMKFDKIISDDVDSYVKEMSFASLGYAFKGNTQALIFDANIDKSRNEFMFKQYAKGYVKNHSVGMRYVKLELAINSESEHDSEEKEVWDKYYKEIANKEVADSKGYFWAVTEAKIIEGSAVPMGSNHVTPTLEVQPKEAAAGTSKTEAKEETQEAVVDTSIEDNIKALQAFNNNLNF